LGFPLIGLFWWIFPAAWLGLTLIACGILLNTAVRVANHGYMPCLLAKGMFPIERSDRWVVAGDKTRLLPLADIHRFRVSGKRGTSMSVFYTYSKGDVLVWAGILLFCLACFRNPLFSLSLLSFGSLALRSFAEWLLWG
jgi:hypothetical protein